MPSPAKKKTAPQPARSKTHPPKRKLTFAFEVAAALQLEIDREASFAEEQALLLTQIASLLEDAVVELMEATRESHLFRKAIALRTLGTEGQSAFTKMQTSAARLEALACP